MPLPKREDYSGYREWQDANVAYISRMQIAYCEERRAALSVEDEWAWTPEPTSEGLEDLL